MRLWSLHPRLLDRASSGRLVREGRLAQKVQPGESEGYRFPPQLARFRAANDPVAPFATYLWTFETEATASGSQFNSAKMRQQAAQEPFTDARRPRPHRSLGNGLSSFASAALTALPCVSGPCSSERTHAAQTPHPHR